MYASWHVYLWCDLWSGCLSFPSWFLSLYWNCLPFIGPWLHLSCFFWLFDRQFLSFTRDKQLLSFTRDKQSQDRFHRWFHFILQVSLRQSTFSEIALLLESSEFFGWWIELKGKSWATRTAKCPFCKQIKQRVFFFNLMQEKRNAFQFRSQCRDYFFKSMSVHRWNKANCQDDRHLHDNHPTSRISLKW